MRLIPLLSCMNSVVLFLVEGFHSEPLPNRMSLQFKELELEVLKRNGIERDWVPLFQVPTPKRNCWLSQKISASMHHSFSAERRQHKCGCIWILCTTNKTWWLTSFILRYPNLAPAKTILYGKTKIEVMVTGLACKILARATYTHARWCCLQWTILGRREFHNSEPDYHETTTQP